MKKSYVATCLETRFSIFEFLSLLTFLSVLCLFPQNVYSLDVSLVWNANSEDNLAGYRIFHREDGQSYDYKKPAWEGKETTCTIYNLNNNNTYYFVARAFDTEGSESGNSNETSYQFNEPPLDIQGSVEIGEVSVDHNWKRVEFSKAFSNPVVVAKPLSCKENEPAVIRIGNVDKIGFKIRIQEWNYLNGTHTAEDVSYIVMERGSYILEDGTKVEAGKFDTDSTGSFEWIGFSQTFNKVPVVTSSVSSFNEEDAVCSRLKNIDNTGFDFCMQEQELNRQIHTTETISYIAWEPSSGTVGDLTFEINKTDDVITHNLQTIVYNENFLTYPVFLADMQTTDGGDTANLRWQNKDSYGIDIKITEEQSRDSEIGHTTEVVGYMVFAKIETDVDTDGDGLTDNDEINVYGTNPNNPDTDGDDINDGNEVEFWGDNWDMDFDNDGIINILDLDSDNDGFSDGTEKDEGSDPGDPTSKPGDPNHSPEFPLEIGEVSVDQNWKWVEFNDMFIDPVVVANSLSYNGGNPAVVRIQNVDSTGFYIRIQEWDYLNGIHTTENVSYIVMERGSYTLEDGTKVEAGKFDTDATGSFEWVGFSETFNQVPVVTSSVSSFNEEDAVCSRLKNIDTTGFDFCMQEQELNRQIHTTETISYIAWEPSSGTVDNLTFEINKTDDVITHNLQTIVYNENFLTSPVFLADMQTTDGRDTANLRRQNKDSYGIDIKITEEQSRDSEITHTTEVVGYMVFAKIETDVDTDGDGLTDNDEINVYGTNPNNPDTDGDDINDGNEVEFWGDNWDMDFDNDGIINILDLDSDNDGFSDGSEKDKGFDPGDPNSRPAFTLEIGEVQVDHNWKRIELNNTFIDPVVVANSLSYNGGDSAVVRIQNVDSTGFYIRIQEWDYLNEIHITENVSYVVIERGSYILEDGTKIEAGKFDTDATGSFEWSGFSETFNRVPVVTSSVSSFNEEDAVCCRLKNINNTGFDFCMQEQELNRQIHTTETISYIAWEPSSGTVDNLTFEINKTDDVITHNLQTIVYNENFLTSPVFLADMQTTDGSDTANLRRQNKDSYGIDIKITEEQSRDSEIDHTTEVVGYMVFAFIK